MPILVYALRESVHLATGTALAIVGANALVGAWEHRRAGRVRLPVALAFAGAGIVGALRGSWLNHLAPARLVLIGFALLMLAAAVASAVLPHPCVEPRPVHAGGAAGNTSCLLP